MSAFFSRLLSFLLRLVFVAAGLVFAAVVVVFGMVLGLFIVLWSLVRGRKPQGVRFKMGTGSPFQRPPVQPANDDNVVDIEAREVPDVPSRLTQDRG